jgi:DNA repair photolyase
MSVIYKPKGAAAEYAEFAFNACKGCTFGCTYCYAPPIMWKSPEKYHSDPDIKLDVVKKFQKEAEKHKGLKEEFLMNFIGDPYMNDEVSKITHDVLIICEENEFKNVNILTKGGLKATNDFEILQRNNWKFGQTIIFWDDELRKEFEPDASSIESRYAALKLASTIDLYSWISLEPIIFPNQAYEVINNIKEIVDYWKIGKINHRKDLDLVGDWSDVVINIKKLLQNKEYLLKDSLKKFDK